MLANFLQYLLSRGLAYCTLRTYLTVITFVYRLHGYSFRIGRATQMHTDGHPAMTMAVGTWKSKAYTSYVR